MKKSNMLKRLLACFLAASMTLPVATGCDDSEDPSGDPSEEQGLLKVDVDKNESLARKHGIMSIPTIEIYDKGNLVDKQVGLLSKEEIEDLLK